MSKNNYINILLLSWSGIIGWLLNYLYHPLMLQYLTLEEFWVFWSLVWLFNILWVLITGLILFLNKEISINLNDKSKIKYIYIESLKIFWLLWIFSYFLFSLFSPVIARFLKIDDTFIIIIVGFSIILSFLWTSINSTLRWLKKFYLLALEWIIVPFIKLALWFLFVYLGYKIYWAIIWFLISWIIMSGFGFIYLLSYFKKIKKTWTTKDLLKNFYSNKKEIAHFFLISLFFATLMNIDVILVKNIFDEKTAWIYSWISILGKFLIFLLFSIETVYYGQIMECKNKNIPFHLIKNPLILIVITSIIAIIINYFIWWFILKILKEELADYTSIYLLILVYYSFLALISFYTKVLIWWWKYYINYIMLLLTVSLIILIYTFWKESLENFVYSFIIVGIISTIILSWIFFKEYRKLWAVSWK